MKHRTLSLVVLMASLTATAGTISKTYNFSSSQVEVNSVSTDNGSRSMVTYNTNTDSEIRAGDLLSSSLYNTTESNGLKEYYIKTLVGDPLCRLFVHQPLILEAVENTVDYNGEYRTYNVNSGNAKLHVGRAPIEDATYAYRNTASNTHTDSIKITLTQQLAYIPQVLPLKYCHYTWRIARFGNILHHIYSLMMFSLEIPPEVVLITCSLLLAQK